MVKAIKKILKWLLIGLVVFGIVSAITAFISTFAISYHKAKEDTALGSDDYSFTATVIQDSQVSSLRFEEIPEYNGEVAIEINNNEPELDVSGFGSESFVQLSELDSLGRPGYAVALVDRSLMPSEPREEIGQIRPAGWHTVRYDDVIEDKYLYNRCHIIGFQLCGINSDIRDLFTGTRYLNVSGMLPFENEVASYVRRTNQSVLYRVTPIYHGDELIARGVQMEAMSVNDGGLDLHFNVFVYNVQPGISIDYTDGNSWVS